MKNKVLFLLFGIIFSFLFLRLLDFLVGSFWLKENYFAMQPNIKEITDTKDFTVAIDISSQGLRNEIVDVPKPKNTYRILALGDSFTFGWGVEALQSWPKILEQIYKTQNPLNKDIEIINAGIPGGNLVNEKSICKGYAQKFNPDLFLLGLFANDLYQPSSHQFLIILPEKITSLLVPNIARLNIPSLFSVQQNFTYEKIEKSSLAWAKMVKFYLIAKPNMINSIDPKLKKDFLSGKINPASVREALDNETIMTYLKDSEQGNLILKERLEKIKKECIKDKPMVVVFLPSSDLVSKSYLPGRKALGFKIDESLLAYDFDSNLKKVVENVGFTYLSVLNDFRKDGCPGCYYEYDLHLTPLGHQKVVEYLAPKINNKIKEAN